jgi:medium-chain acyl-[acyl-carrier-protein] hydrolase
MTALTVDSPFVRRARRPEPKWRLFCLPYAGAGASMFAHWPNALPEDIEVVALQLPGREDRLTDAPLIDSTTIVRVVSQVMQPYLRSPYALFGHCAGALTAFEVGRQLARRGRGPSHLFVAAQNAPHLPFTSVRLHELPDHDFLAAVRDLGGVRPEVAANDQLMAILLGALRADFTAWEGYRYMDGDSLSCPITVFGGTHDPRVSPTGLEEWRRHTTGQTVVRMLKADHFFTAREEAVVLQSIVNELGQPGRTET